MLRVHHVARLRGSRQLLAILLACAIAIASFGCNRSSASSDSGTLAKAAAAAKAAGKDTTTLSVNLHEGGSDATLDETVRTMSILLLEPRRLNAVVSADPHFIQTWHIFHVAESISTRPPVTPAPCDLQTPSGLNLTMNEIAIPLAGGTKVIDGVAVTMTPLVSMLLAPDRRYLAIATVCPGNIAVPPDSVLDLFDVTPDGAIRTRPEQLTIPFAKELQALGTVAQLKERVTATAIK